MSKYSALWEYIRNDGRDGLVLTFDEIAVIAGLALDHSFLVCKKELPDYGYTVGRISLKARTVVFTKIPENGDKET